jgi:polyhydroxyalkanoate synthesis regulator phasin
MYEEWDFQEDQMRNMLEYFSSYTKATRDHIKQLEGFVEMLERRIQLLEKQNECLQMYIKSGEKMIDASADFK